VETAHYSQYLPEHVAVREECGQPYTLAGHGPSAPLFFLRDSAAAPEKKKSQFKAPTCGVNVLPQGENRSGVPQEESLWERIVDLPGRTLVSLPQIRP
jgi:hypothetical protein